MTRLLNKYINVKAKNMINSKIIFVFLKQTRNLFLGGSLQQKIAIQIIYYQDETL